MSGFTNILFLVSSRKLRSNSLKSEEEKEELVKELRWHYKQFVRASKRNKGKLVHVSSNLSFTTGFSCCHTILQVHVFPFVLFSNTRQAVFTSMDFRLPDGLDRSTVIVKGFAQRHNPMNQGFNSNHSICIYLGNKITISKTIASSLKKWKYGHLRVMVSALVLGLSGLDPSPGQ